MVNDNSLDSWDKFTSKSFLKPETVTNDNTPFVVINIEIAQKQDEKGNVMTVPRLTLENNEIPYEFDLNRTNSNKLKELNVKSPKLLIGKKLYFKKVNVVVNRKELEGLRVWKVE